MHIFEGAIACTRLASIQHTHLLALRVWAAATGWSSPRTICNPRLKKQHHIVSHAAMSLSCGMRRNGDTKATCSRQSEGQSKAVQRRQQAEGAKHSQEDRKARRLRMRQSQAKLTTSRTIKPSLARTTIFRRCNQSRSKPDVNKQKRQSYLVSHGNCRQAPEHAKTGMDRARLPWLLLQNLTLATSPTSLS